MLKHKLLNLRNKANHLLVLQKFCPQGYHQDGCIHNLCTWNAYVNSHTERKQHTSWHKMLERVPDCVADSGC